MGPDRRYGRVLGWLAAGTLLAALLVAGLLAGVAGTPEGTRLALAKALARVPYLTVDRIQGTLWQGVVLEEIRYADPAGARVRVEQARLSLAWPALLRGRLHLRWIEAAGTEVQVPPAPAAETAAAPRMEALIPRLPLEVRVDALRLEELRLRTDPAADPVHLTRLDAALRLERSRIVVNRLTLSLEAPVALRLEARAALETAAPHHLDLRLDGALNLAQGDLTWALASAGGMEWLRTTGRLEWLGRGTPDASVELALEHGFTAARIERLTAALLEGRLEISGEVDWRDGVDWTATLDGDRLVPGPWFEAATGPVGFRLETRGRLSPRGGLAHDTRLTRGRAEIAGITLTDLALHAGGDEHHAKIHDLAVNLLAGRLAARGEIDWRDDLGWRVEVRAADLDPGHWDPAAAGRVGFGLSSRGRIDAGGHLTHETRLADLTGMVAGIPFETVGLAAAGDLDSLQIRDLAGRVLDARLAGEADLRWDARGVGWQGRLSLDQADPSRLEALGIAPLVPGRIGLDLTSSGTWHEGVPRATASLHNLRGEVAGQPLAGALKARIEGQRVHLEPADVTLGASQVHVAGAVTPPFDLQFRFDLPDLSRLPLAPELGLNPAGRLRGQGRLGGTLAAPDLQARLEGRRLAVETLTLERIDLEAEADTNRLAVEASLTGLALAGHRVDTAGAAIRGRLADHRLTLAARSDLGRLDLDLQGALEGNRWQGRLTGLTLNQTPAGDWRLAEPAQIRAAAQDLALEDICLVPAPRPPGAGGQRAAQRESGEARICLSARRPPGEPLEAALAATLPLVLLRPLLPPDLVLPGTATLDATARIGEALEARATLDLPDHRLIVRGVADGPLELAYQDTRVDIRLRDQRLAARLQADLSGALALEGEIAARLDGDQPVSGQVRARIADMAWLNVLVPQISDLAGRAEVDLDLAGTLDRPHLAGRIRVAELSLNLPQTGAAYHQGALRVDLDADRGLSLEGRLAGATGGQVQITGRGALDRLPAWRLELAVDGEDLPLLRTSELTVDASPALRVTADAQTAEIRGRVILPRVEARIKTLPEGSVNESSDLVIAGRETAAGPAYRVRTDVEIVLGEKVSLEGMGFSADLGGQIRLRGDDTAPMAAFGEVEVRKGRYVAYGQDLRISQGRLTFNGPLADPGLDVRATRTVGNYQAGLKIEGTLATPRTEVFAAPALPESDALSLLLTGRRLSEGTSQTEAEMLINALAGLGVKKGDDIARDIGLVAGLDELGLDTDSGLHGAQLTIGKRLHPRLLVRYAVGIFDGVSKFITEYKINRYLDLEITSSPEAQGGDLILRLER